MFTELSVQPPTASRTYPIFGDEAAPTVTFFGSWKCAKTAAYIQGAFQTVLSKYVLPGDVAVEFRDVAYTDDGPYLGSDAPNAGNAGLAVWHTAPDRYARYFGTVFVNRPPTDTAWATPAQLGAFARYAGLTETDRIRTAVRANRYEMALRETTDLVYEYDIDGVPRVVVDGTVTAPVQDPGELETAIDTMLG